MVPKSWKRIWGAKQMWGGNWWSSVW